MWKVVDCNLNYFMTIQLIGMAWSIINLKCPMTKLSISYIVVTLWDVNWAYTAVLSHNTFTELHICVPIKGVIHQIVTSAWQMLM